LLVSAASILDGRHVIFACRKAPLEVTRMTNHTAPTSTAAFGAIR
jgi:hypothetical protein